MKTTFLTAHIYHQNLYIGRIDTGNAAGLAKRTRLNAVELFARFGTQGYNTLIIKLFRYFQVFQLSHTVNQFAFLIYIDLIFYLDLSLFHCACIESFKNRLQGWNLCDE